MFITEELCCPVCKGPLSQDQANSGCVCKDHGLFPIRDNIVSFAGSDDFDEHWQDNYTEAIPAAKIAVANEFLAPLLTHMNKEREGMKILDGGCGDGIHCKLLEDLLNRDQIYYGVDISQSALMAARTRIAGDHTHFIQADIGKLPFRDSYFDCSFSFGVLAYTDNPFHSFKELVRVTRPGGMIGIWIYPRQSGLGGMLFNIIRSFCRLTGKAGTQFLANLIVPFLGLLPTRSKMSLANSSWKQCKEIVMVNIAPTQLFFPEQSEILAWFKQMNITVVHNPEDNLITLWGIKPSDEVNH